MNRNNLLKFIAAVVVSEFVGVIGAFFTAPAIPAWYATLAKPGLNPPAWVFAPVWTALYALMGIALFLVWKERANIRSKTVAWEYWVAGIALYAAQLALNALWSFIFFGLRNPSAAFFELTILWFAIFATIATFAQISKPAAWLMAPYLLWVSFAGYLNYAIWMLN